MTPQRQPPCFTVPRLKGFVMLGLSVLKTIDYGSYVGVPLHGSVTRTTVILTYEGRILGNFADFEKVLVESLRRLRFWHACGLTAWRIMG